ncbi:hypothetical protein ANN_02658 [Periplaneta americana]|uniref:DUF4817 domain-containing protein n=1 Tax=Periplaneta americana TaxID=6978 RepID=A0ABQ8TX41_PERAM|nr:hypothetical protein ANN_02658 [Periplaneta americana]
MYGKADGIAALARRLYQERYPQRQCPDRKTFVRLHYRLCEYGKFNSPGLGRGRPRSTTPEVWEEILEAVNMTPSISTRRVALQVNVPHTTVWRLLKEYQLYPYHLQRVQALSPADYPARVRFCQWFLQQCGVNPNFPALVLFTDEAQFTRDGITNFHNQHVWVYENPVQLFHLITSTEISQNLASVAQTTTCTAAMIAIEPSSSFVAISLQRDVIVVQRSGLLNKIRRIQLFKNKILRTTVKALWFVRNSQLHSELKLYTIQEFIRKFLRNCLLKIFAFLKFDPSIHLIVHVFNSVSLFNHRIKRSGTTKQKRVKCGSSDAYDIFPRRPNAILIMMSKTRNARDLRDETRNTSATNTASESGS